MWIFEEGDTPVLVTAIHNGHFVREELLRIMNISELERLKEEDPYTVEFTTVSDCRFINYLSRFEVDFNRPEEKAVYLTPEQAWGLELWKEKPTKEIIERSLNRYRTFYRELKEFLDRLVDKFGKLVVYDVHSYNYRRGGVEAPKEGNPDINVGTGTILKPEKWRRVIDRFIEMTNGMDFFGEHLDVRENVRFRGGFFPRWIHRNYPDNIAVLSLEFKKIFMDELTGELYPEKLKKLKDILKETIEPIVEELKRI